jgi:hypothetical protein
MKFSIDVGVSVIVIQRKGVEYGKTIFQRNSNTAESGRVD